RRLRPLHSFPTRRSSDLPTRSVALPLPSSPHWAPTSVIAGIGLYLFARHLVGAFSTPNMDGPLAQGSDRGRCVLSVHDALAGSLGQMALHSLWRQRIGGRLKNAVRGPPAGYGESVPNRPPRRSTGLRAPVLWPTPLRAEPASHIPGRRTLRRADRPRARSRADRRTCATPSSIRQRTFLSPLRSG